MRAQRSRLPHDEKRFGDNGSPRTSEVFQKPLCRLDALIARAEVLAKFGWRLAEDAFEHAVELRERLKTDVVGDLADSAARIQELRFCVLQPHPRDIIGKFETGGPLEDFAEMKHARARRLGHGCE